MMRIKNLIILLLAAALVLAGCENKESTTREDMLKYQMSAEALMAEGDYPNLNNLMGGMTFQDLFDLLSGCLDAMDALAKMGDITQSDGETLLAILDNLYNMLLEDKARYEATADQLDPEGDAMAEASDAMIALLSQAARPGQNPGVLLDQIINQLGRDNSLLTDRIYPLLAYLIAVDEETLKDAVGGGASIKISGLDDYDKFKTVMDTLGGMLDQEGKYAAIHTALDGLLQTMEDNDLGITVGDVRDLLDSLLDSSETKAVEESGDISLSDELIESILDGLSDLWVTDQAEIEGLLAGLLDETADLLTYEEGGVTDFEHILDELIRISNPAVLNRSALEGFVDNVMDAMAATADAEATKGMLSGIASIDPAYLNDIDTGLAGFFANNMYRVERANNYAVPTGVNGEKTSASCTVRMSQLRALCMLMDASNMAPSLGGEAIDKLPGWAQAILLPFKNLHVLPLMRSTDGDVVRNINMGEWTVGEIVSALKAAKAYNNPLYAFSGDLDIAEADFNGDGAVTPFEAYDWVLFKKNYNLLGINIPGLTAYDGLVGMMQNTASLMAGNTIPHAVFDAFPAFLELAGGADSDSNGSVEYGTAGQRHTLFAMFAPLMEFFWDQGRVLDMNGLLEAMNEIDPAGYGYRVFPYEYSWEEVFVDDEIGYVLKTIEGVDGRGLPYYALRGHGGSGIMDPILNLLVKVLGAVDTDALVDELLAGDKSAAEEGVSLDILDDVFSFLVDNKAALVAIAPAVADLLRAVAASVPDLSADIQKIADSVDVTFEEGEGGGSPDGLIDYLTAENPDGSDNAFMANAKWMICRMLDIRDATYNPKGTLTDDSTIGDVLKRIDDLYGEGIDNLLGFVAQAAKMTEELYTLIYGDTEEKATLERIMGDEELPFSFLQALFKGVDADGDGVNELDSVVLQLLSVLSIDNVSMEALMGEIVQLMSGSDMSPGSETYDMLIDTLSFVVGNTHATNIK